MCLEKIEQKQKYKAFHGLCATCFYHRFFLLRWQATGRSSGEAAGDENMASCLVKSNDPMYQCIILCWVQKNHEKPSVETFGLPLLGIHVHCTGKNWRICEPARPVCAYLPNSTKFHACLPPISHRFSSQQSNAGSPAATYQGTGSSKHQTTLQKQQQPQQQQHQHHQHQHQHQQPPPRSRPAEPDIPGAWAPSSGAPGAKPWHLWGFSGLVVTKNQTTQRTNTKVVVCFVVLFGLFFFTNTFYNWKLLVQEAWPGGSSAPCLGGGRGGRMFGAETFSFFSEVTGKAFNKNNKQLLQYSFFEVYIIYIYIYV